MEWSNKYQKGKSDIKNCRGISDKCNTNIIIHGRSLQITRSLYN